MGTRAEQALQDFWGQRGYIFFPHGLVVLKLSLWWNSLVAFFKTQVAGPHPGASLSVGLGLGPENLHI